MLWAISHNPVARLQHWRGSKLSRTSRRTARYGLWLLLQALAMGPVTGIIPQPTVSVPPGTVPSCPMVSKYYHANVVYSGSTNGVSATFAPWNVPYVCDESQEHSLESVGMFLPHTGLTGSNDYLEIGEVRGLVTDDNGHQSHIL